MRVTLLCLEWPHAGHTGGVGRYAYRLATALAAMPEVEVTVVTFSGGTHLEGAVMRTVPRATSRLGRFYWAPFRLRDVVAATRPDVVHSFGDDWALRKSRVPLVRTFHGSALSEARSSTGLRRLNHYLLALTEQFSARRAAIKIGVGPDSVEAFACDDIMPPVTTLDPPKGVLKTTDPSVVFVGSHSGRKRGNLVASVVDSVRAETRLPIALIVIGPASDAEAWPDETHHVAGASDAEVLEIVSSSWVLLAPSLYEGFGIPTYEALAVGTPVIASSNPGSEFIRSLTTSGTVIDITQDEGLRAALVSRLTRGPGLDPSEEETRRAAVERLALLASPSRLVQEIYPAARRKMKDRRRPLE